MLIFAIETSCDETAVAVMRNGRETLSSELFSQADMHAMYGGVVPEIASRNHAAIIGRLSELALKNAGITKNDIDAVAVTYAPGLIGALLVGVNFAKGFAMALDVPLIPVHHIRGHIAANYIAFPELEPPFLCMIVSGGNSIIADVCGYTDIRIIGRSRDDAAGECFDKVARVLGLGYPGGPALDKLVQGVPAQSDPARSVPAQSDPARGVPAQSDPARGVPARGADDSCFKLPRPVIDGAPYDMSFSGLKTSIVNLVHNAEQKGESLDKASLAASFSRTVSDILVPRVMAAASEFGRDKIAIAGGVAANSRIREDFLKAAKAESRTLFIPPLKLCGDNAAMIGCQGYYEFLAGVRADMSLDACATMDADVDYVR